MRTALALTIGLTVGLWVLLVVWILTPFWRLMVILSRFALIVCTGGFWATTRPHRRGWRR